MDNLEGRPNLEGGSPTGNSGGGPGSPPSGGFEFNNPTVISLLYISSAVLGITALVGVILAYVWKAEPKAEWEVSHYQYLINTFWIALVGSVISFILMLVLIGFLLIVAVWILVIVRCVLSLVNAQKHLPMPNPGTLLA
jgi:uncharacterized membrane protein